LTLLSSTPRTGAPPRISSGSDRWQPRADSLAPHAVLLLVRLEVEPRGLHSKGGGARTTTCLRQRSICSRVEGRSFGWGRRAQGLHPERRAAREEGQPSSRSRRRRRLPWRASRGGATERRRRQRNPGGFAPSAEISADGVDPHLGRIFAPGSNPSPTAPQANTPKTGSTHPGSTEHPNQIHS
jgi:hypothetical protein